MKYNETEKRTILHSFRDKRAEDGNFSPEVEKVLSDIYGGDDTKIFRDDTRIFHLMDREYYSTTEGGYTRDVVDIVKHEDTREYFGVAINGIRSYDSTYSIEIREIKTVDNLLSFTMSYKEDIDNHNVVKIIQNELESLGKVAVKPRKLIMFKTDVKRDENGKLDNEVNTLLTNIKEGAVITNLIDNDGDDITLAREVVAIGCSKHSGNYVGIGIIEIEADNPYSDEPTYDIEIKELENSSDLYSFTMSYQADIDVSKDIIEGISEKMDKKNKTKIKSF